MTTELQTRLKLIEGQKSAYEKLLPAHIKADKFIEVAKTFFRDPKIKDNFLKAEMASVLAAINQAAKDGLLIDKKEAAITFLKTKVGNQWIMTGSYMWMVAGVIKLMRNSGAISTLAARIVYENELKQKRFSFSIEDGFQKLHHEPILFGEKGPMIGVYACAVQKDGELVFDSLDNKAIAKRKESAKTKYIWDEFYEEMSKKSALHSLKKLLDLSSDKKVVEIMESENDFQEKEEEPKGKKWFKEGSEGAEAESKVEVKAETAKVEEKPEPVKTESVKEKPAPANTTQKPASKQESSPKPQEQAPKLTLYEQALIEAKKGRDALHNWYTPLSDEERREINPFMQKELIPLALKAAVAPVAPAQEEEPVEESEEYEDVPFHEDAPENQPQEKDLF